jgi:hypothetical protein
MRKIKMITAALVLAFLFSCAAKEMTPATEIVYEGELIGNETVTYPSAKKALELCMRVKSCMGLNEYSYPLPKIRGMSGGNAVECGDRLSRACYRGDGWIIVPEGEKLDVIAHECVHHWLNMHNGDLDPLHESPFFLTCGGNFTLEFDTE